MKTLPPSEDLGLFLQRAVLPTGWRVLYEPVVQSTMDVAREAARRGWPDRSVFVCDYQTAGRGRLGRSWDAPPAQGLLFTVLLRSDDPPLSQTMLASVALAEAIERLTQVEPEIKWPNDLLLENAKLAGVLAERYSGPPSDFTLVGCGLNVNQDARQLMLIGRPVASLAEAAGRRFHRGELLVLILERFAAWLALESGERAEGLRRAWRQRLWGQGHVLRINDGGEEFLAMVEGVDADGALVVRSAEGRRRIVTGEIVLELA